MESKKHRIKARPGLQSVYLGIPLDLAVSICNFLRADDFEIDRSMSLMDRGTLPTPHDLEPIICQLSFLIVHPALRDHDFLGFISDKPYLEASEEIVSKIQDSEVKLTFSSPLQALDAKWLSVKAHIDEGNLAALLEDVMCGLADREIHLLRLMFGLDDGKPRSVIELAKHFNLTRARIYQLKNSSLRALSRKVTGRTIQFRRIPRPALAMWVSELFDLCVLRRVSLQSAIDYLELRSPNESRLLWAIYPTRAAIIHWQVEARHAVVNPAITKSMSERIAMLSDTQLKSLGDFSLTEFLTVRTVSILQEAGITTAADLVELLSQEQLLRVPNLGKKNLSEIEGLFTALIDRSELIATLSDAQLEMMGDPPVAELGLSVRTVLVLQEAGITRASDLAKLSAVELSRMPNLIRTSFREIEAAIVALIDKKDGHLGGPSIALSEHTGFGQ